MQAKELFIKYVEDNINRPGIENLMDWIETETDFFISPASTRYHGSYDGGLLDHSLNVYEQLLVELDQAYGVDKWQSLFSEETVALVALFHDLCKVNTYETFYRNVKDDNTGQWDKVLSYRHSSNTFEMGHGAKSSFYLQKFMELTDEEAQAIFWHMGAYDISAYMTLNGLSSAWNSNALAFFLSRADIFVTYVTENNKFVYPENVEADENVNVDTTETTKVEPYLAQQRTYLQHEGTGEVFFVEKGTDLNEYLDGREIIDIVDKRVYEEYKAEQEAIEFENKRKAEKTGIRMPGRGKATKAKEENTEVVEEEDLNTEVVEETEVREVATKASYFIEQETGEPVKALKGESLAFLSEGDYTAVTAKEYREALKLWEAEDEVLKESIPDEAEEVSNEVTYWYIAKTDEYVKLEAGESTELDSSAVQVQQDEYEEYLDTLQSTESVETDEKDSDVVESEETVEVDDKTTYWFDNVDESYFLIEAGEALPSADEDVEELSAEDYLDAVQPKLESDYYYYHVNNKDYGIIKKGERIPEDFDEDVYEEITKAAYKDATSPKEEKPVKTQKARRRTPAPTRRPK